MKIKSYLMILLAALALIINASSAKAQQTVQVTPEHFMAYSLYNFSKFIEWPNSPIATTFSIAVVGDKSVFQELNQLAANKKIGKAIYKIDYFKSTAEVNGEYNIVFLSNLQSSKIKEMVTRYEKNNVLMVTEREGMTKFGSTICFTTDKNGAMGFEIAKGNANQNQLVVKSQLERLAARVL